MLCFFDQMFCFNQTNINDQKDILAQNLEFILFLCSVLKPCPNKKVMIFYWLPNLKIKKLLKYFSISDRHSMEII